VIILPLLATFNNLEELLDGEGITAGRILEEDLQKRMSKLSAIQVREMLRSSVILLCPRH
jgi:hypothetical protein